MFNCFLHEKNTVTKLECYDAMILKFVGNASTNSKRENCVHLATIKQMENRCCCITVVQHNTSAPFRLLLPASLMNDHMRRHNN